MASISASQPEAAKGSHPTTCLSFVLGPSALTCQHHLRREILGSGEHMVLGLGAGGEEGQGVRAQGREFLFKKKPGPAVSTSGGRCPGTFYVERGGTQVTVFPGPFPATTSSEKCQLGPLDGQEHRSKQLGMGE